MGLGNFVRNITDKIRRSPTDFRNSVRSQPYEVDEPFVQPAESSSGKFGLKGRIRDIGNSLGFNRLSRTGKTNQAYGVGLSTKVDDLSRFTRLDDGNYRLRVEIRNPRTGILDTKTIDLTRDQLRQFNDNPQSFAENNLTGLDKYVGKGFEVVSWENY